MPKLLVLNFAMSIDGYAAGPNQSLDDPLGERGTELHDWVFATRTGQEMIGEEGGESGIDDDFLARGFAGIGATIMGRNMFGPVRGAWTDEEWEGWWGPNPPYHHNVFVLTHHARPALSMKGGTTFHFVADPIETVLERAFEAASGEDVRLGGGASTVQQYLRAGLVDELHVPLVPILLCGGERLFDNLGGGPDGYECAELIASPAVVHARFVRGG